MLKEKNKLINLHAVFTTYHISSFNFHNLIHELYIMLMIILSQILAYGLTGFVILNIETLNVQH